MATQRRLIVIGAGPIGLMAALDALEAGFDVTVLEQGRVGDAVRRWGSVRLFTPMAMNLTPAARRVLAGRSPGDDALLTGAQLVERVLTPLADSPPLAGRVLQGHQVMAVGRAGMTRTDFAGHPLRAERPFRVLARTSGAERRFEAEVVLDAGGVSENHTFAGEGGLPAPGERETGSRIIRHLGELESSQRRLRGGRVLLIGHGHSAAHAVLALGTMASESPGTHLVWATRSANRRPVAEVAADPLPERQRVASAANDLAQAPPAWLEVERRVTLESVRLEPTEPDTRSDDRRLRARLSSGREELFDEVLAFTGYRPDMSALTELELEVSPVTEGAARLSRALACVTDCLSVPVIRPEDLESGEPGFHLIGAKSYGRSRTFLIRTGLAHVASILERVR